jgi:hypothetical protein
MIWINNWYFLLLLISIIIHIIPTRIISKYDSYVFLFLIIITVCAIVNRPLTFNDDDNYLSMISDFQNVNISELGKISTLFYYLNIFLLQFTSNVEFVLKINFILIWIIIATSFFYEKLKNKTIYFTFLLMLFQILFFIQLRNAFAIVFLNWAIIRYYKNKSYSLFLLLSVLFHFSVLPFIIVFYITKYLIKTQNNFKLKRQWISFVAAIIISILFFNIYNNYIVILPLFEKYFTDFINTPEVGNTSIVQMFLLVFHLLLFLPLRVKNQYINRSLYVIYSGLLLGIVFFTLPLFQRIIVPFYLFSITTYIYILNKQSKKYFNLYYHLTILIYFMISFNRISYFENWSIF